jgi:hypothetical protein
MMALAQTTVQIRTQSTAVFVVLVVVYAVAFAAILVAFAAILRKAGYPGWWALAGLVPVVNVVLLFVFAFAQWPVLTSRRSSWAPPAPPLPPPPRAQDDVDSPGPVPEER